jgi:hypothetical protein
MHICFQYWFIGQLSLKQIRLSKYNLTQYEDRNMTSVIQLVGRIILSLIFILAGVGKV